jgi:hypothetical protein
MARSPPLRDSAGQKRHNGVRNAVHGTRETAARWRSITGFLEATMHGIIYLVGLIVVIMAVLSFFGLR